MNDHQAAIAPGFYDHELDEAPRRERQAADWGADDVFATAPRRRFRSAHRRQEGASWMTQSDEIALSRVRQAAERRESHPRPAPAAAQTEAVEEAHIVAPPSEVEFTAPPRERPEVDEATGRRTVVVTGRPEGAPPPARAAHTERRRPPRSVEDRVVGPRPDRIAAWACGMGLALILIAVSTADAAPL